MPNGSINGFTLGIGDSVINAWGFEVLNLERHPDKQGIKQILSHQPKLMRVLKALPSKVMNCKNGFPRLFHT